MANTEVTAENSPRHHPLDRAWLSEVNELSRLYAKGEFNITEFRALLHELRKKHNRVVKRHA
jgi:hypothetical protein